MPSRAQRLRPAPRGILRDPEALAQRAGSPEAGTVEGDNSPTEARKGPARLRTVPTVGVGGSVCPYLALCHLRTHPLVWGPLPWPHGRITRSLSSTLTPVASRTACPGPGSYGRGPALGSVGGVSSQVTSHWATRLSTWPGWLSASAFGFRLP